MHVVHRFNLGRWLVLLHLVLACMLCCLFMLGDLKNQFLSLAVQAALLILHKVDAARCQGYCDDIVKHIVRADRCYGELEER